jgi:hypothetical protein
MTEDARLRMVRREKIEIVLLRALESHLREHASDWGAVCGALRRMEHVHEGRLLGAIEHGQAAGSGVGAVGRRV